MSVNNTVARTQSCAGTGRVPVRNSSITIGDVSIFGLHVVNFWSARPRWPRMTAGTVGWRGLISSASNVSWVHFSFSCAKVPRKTPQGRSRMTDPEVLFVRRRPSLPHGPPCSTIGAERLNFRVRNGAGCFPLAMITETLWRYSRALFSEDAIPTVSRELHSGRETSM